jgi:hypothetical protein
MGIKRTKEEIEKIVNDNGYKLLKEYRNKFNASRVTFQDSYGYKYDTLFTGILSKYETRPVSKHNPFSLENLSIWLKLNNKKFSLIDNNFYMGCSSSNLKFLCFICGESFYSSWVRIYTGCGCPFCAGKKISEVKSLSYLRPDLAKEWHPTKNGSLIPENVSLGSNRKVWWICSSCGYNWKCSIVARSSRGTYCTACSGRVVTDKNRLSILFPEISLDWHPYKNKNLFPETVSFGMKKKVWWLCQDCGYEWNTTIISRTRGSGCPKCKESKGEKRVSKFFDKNSIIYIPQHKFDGCRNINLLPFDFYLFHFNLCIEYHGEQHFKAREYFGGKSAFEKQQKRDKIKFDYCKTNGIPLIVIPYWDYNNIESILEKELLIYA